MQELMKKIAENKELQAQLKGCRDAKAMAQLLGIDGARAEKLFPKLKTFLENGTLPDDLLDKASGGSAASGADPLLGDWLTDQGGVSGSGKSNPYGGATGGF